MMVHLFLKIHNYCEIRVARKMAIEIAARAIIMITVTAKAVKSSIWSISKFNFMLDIFYVGFLDSNQCYLLGNLAAAAKVRTGLESWAIISCPSYGTIEI